MNLFKQRTTISALTLICWLQLCLRGNFVRLVQVAGKAHCVRYAIHHANIYILEIETVIVLVNISTMLLRVTLVMVTSILVAQ